MHYFESLLNVLRSIIPQNKAMKDVAIVMKAGQEQGAKLRKFMKMLLMRGVNVILIVEMTENASSEITQLKMELSKPYQALSFFKTTNTAVVHQVTSV